MKIGINARTFSITNPGGEVQSAIKLMLTLMEISNSEHEFIIFGHKSIKRLFGQSNLDCSLYFVKSQAWGLIWEQMLPILARKHNIEVMLSPTSNGPMFIPTYNDFKNIVWIHDVNQFYEWGGTIAYRYLSRIRYPRIAKLADVLITVSKFSKSEIIKFLNIPENKIKVIYNGIDELFLSDRIPGKEIDLPEEYILYVGATHPRKNLYRLLLAYEKIQDRIDEYLVIIGPTPRKIFSEMDFKKFKDNPKLIVKGFVSPEELKYAYQNASLLVYPSIYEGFGLPPLEALACGTPIVVSRIPSLVEILQDNAHYVNPYSVEDIVQGILIVLEDTSYQRRLVNRGKRHARQFTWEKSAREVLNLIENI